MLLFQPLSLLKFCITFLVSEGKLRHIKHFKFPQGKNWLESGRELHLQEVEIFKEKGWKEGVEVINWL